MKSKEKSVNRKAMPKFIGTILLSVVIGDAAVFAVEALQGSTLPERILTTMNRGLDLVTPWGIPVVTAVLMGLSLWLYRSAKRAFQAWDGEDEVVMDTAEEKLSWIILLTSINLLLDFFFLAAAFQEQNWSQSGFLHMMIAVCFLLSLALLGVMQQKVVDLTRAMNPEKTVSIYDVGFQKKWYQSCDENERKQIGEASYQAFKVAGNTCLLLWMVLFVLGLGFDIGLLPSALMLVVWGVLQISYVLSCIRMQKRSSLR